MKLKVIYLALALVLIFSMAVVILPENPSSAQETVINSNWATTTPIIDGDLVTFASEWSDAATVSVGAATIYIKNDWSNLYIAAIVPDTTNDIASIEPTYVAGDTFGVLFDEGNDEVILQGDGDGMAMAPIESELYDLSDYVDLFWDPIGTPGSPPVSPDASYHGSGDWAWDGANYYYELSKPLNSGDSEDMAVSPGETVGVSIGYEDVTGGTFTKWPTGHNPSDPTTWGDLVLAIAPPPPTLINSNWATTTPAIDGNLATFADEWNDAAIVSVGAATVYIKNDDANIYCAAIVPDTTNDIASILPTYVAGDTFGVLFDEGNDGVILQGDGDGMAMAPIESGLYDYVDLFWDPLGTLGSPPANMDTLLTDGSGDWTWDGANYYYELSKPLNSGDSEDMAVSSGETVGVSIGYEDVTGGTFTKWPTGHNPSDPTTWGDLVLATAPPTPTPGETLYITMTASSCAPVDVNYRAHNLQMGDEVIQFTRDNLIVGTNPIGGVYTVANPAILTVSGDLSGTNVGNSNVLEVSWDELPPDTRKGYSVGTFTFSDGMGNSFTGVTAGDIDWTYYWDGNIGTGTNYMVSTSGTGEFAGQILIGTGTGSSTFNFSTGCMTTTATSTIRRYSSSEISSLPVSATGSLVYGNVLGLGPSWGPNSIDEFIQFTRPNISIPQGDPVYYVEGCTYGASGTVGPYASESTVSYNSLSVPISEFAMEGFSIGKSTGSIGSMTASGIFVQDDLSDGTSSGYSFGLSFTGDWAGKDGYMVYTHTLTGPDTVSTNGTLYLLTPSEPEPTPTPGETLSISITGTTSLPLDANFLPLNLQIGDEVVQFTRDNLIVGTNPIGSFVTSGTPMLLTVSGDLSGTMTVDYNSIHVEWDELPDGTAKGYMVGTFTFNDGMGNAFSGSIVGDQDIVWNQDGYNIATGPHYMVSTSGTGEFAGQILIGTGTGTGAFELATGLQTTTMTGTLRRYSSSEISSLPVSGTGSFITGNVHGLGPSWGPNSIDEFIQFTRPNISVPQGDPVYYVEGTTAGASGTVGPYASTMTTSGNNLFIPISEFAAEGFNIGKSTGSIGSMAASGILVQDDLGDGTSLGFMFGLSFTGDWAGKDGYMVYTHTSTGPDTVSTSGTLYLLTPSEPESTPPTVTTNSATNVYASSVTLNGYLDNRGTASTVGVYFEWATDDYYTTHDSSYNNETTPPWFLTNIGPVASSLTGLLSETTYHYRAKAVGDGTAYGEDMTFTTTIVGTDGDGVPDIVEDNAPNGGDGNYDGIPDSQQGNVASFPNAVAGGYVAIESPAGTNLENVAAVPENALPTAGKPPIDFPFGFFAFDVTGLVSGATIDLTLTLDDNVPTNTQYWKYGPTPDNHTPHWYQIEMGSNDGDNVITITLTDGGLGDDWWIADTVIVDQGGPGWGPAGGATGVPVFPTWYIGIVAALGAGVLAYLYRRRTLGRKTEGI